MGEFEPIMARTSQVAEPASTETSVTAVADDDDKSGRNDSATRDRHEQDELQVRLLIPNGPRRLATEPQQTYKHSQALRERLAKELRGCTDQRRKAKSKSRGVQCDPAQGASSDRGGARDSEKAAEAIERAGLMVASGMKGALTEHSERLAKAIETCTAAHPDEGKDKAVGEMQRIREEVHKQGEQLGTTAEKICSTLHELRAGMDRDREERDNAKCTTEAATQSGPVHLSNANMQTLDGEHGLGYTDARRRRLSSRMRASSSSDGGTAKGKEASMTQAEREFLVRVDQQPRRDFIAEARRRIPPSSIEMAGGQATPSHASAHEAARRIQRAWRYSRRRGSSLRADSFPRVPPRHGGEAPGQSMAPAAWFQQGAERREGTHGEGTSVAKSEEQTLSPELWQFMEALRAVQKEADAVEHELEESKKLFRTPL